MNEVDGGKIDEHFEDSSGDSTSEDEEKEINGKERRKNTTDGTLSSRSSSKESLISGNLVLGSEYE